MHAIENAVEKEKKGYFYSYKAIFEYGISKYAKIVYFYLARSSDASGKSYHSYKTIAERCSISRRTAQNAVSELKKIGLLNYKNSKKLNGSLGANRYTIYPPIYLSEKETFRAPDAIFDQDMGLSCNAKLILIYLCRCAKGGQASPSCEEIAKACSIKSRQTILDSVKELEKAGLVTKRRAKSNIYIVRMSNMCHTPKVECPTNAIPNVQSMPYPPHECPIYATKGLYTEGHINNFKDNNIEEKVNENQNVVVHTKEKKSKKRKNNKDENEKAISPEVEEIAKRIEKLTGNVVIRQNLIDIPGERLKQAVETYIESSKSYSRPINNPVGLIIFFARKGIQPPRPFYPAGRTNKQLNFNRFEQHNYTDEELESLFENIEADS